MTLIRNQANEYGRSASRTKIQLRPMVLAIIALLGVALMVYPVFATQHNDLKHRKNAQNYQINVQDTSANEREESLVKAEQYNAHYKGGVVLDPYLHRVARKTPEYAEYLDQLNLFDAMSTISIPNLKINLPVYHGTDEDALKNGVGHLYGSSLPVGGKGNHIVLTGHTGLGDATLFNNLNKLHDGDPVYLNTEGRALKYKVTKKEVVLPTEYESLNTRIPDKDLLTLITCTPYGINSHRLLVTAERVALDPVEEEAVKAPPKVELAWEWWMIALLVAAVLGLVIVTVFLWRWQRAIKLAQMTDTVGGSEG